MHGAPGHRDIVANVITVIADLIVWPVMSHVGLSLSSL